MGLNGHWKPIATVSAGLVLALGTWGVDRTWAEIGEVKEHSEGCCAKVEAVKAEQDRRTRDVSRVGKIDDTLPIIRSEVQSANESAARAQRSADRAHKQAEEAETTSREALYQARLNAVGIEYLVKRASGQAVGPPPSVTVD